jgi:hypothetical protein
MLVVPKSEHKSLSRSGRTPAITQSDSRRAHARGAEVSQAGDVSTAGCPPQTSATVEQFAFADESSNGIMHLTTCRRARELTEWRSKLVSCPRGFAVGDARAHCRHQRHVCTDRWKSQGRKGPSSARIVVKRDPKARRNARAAPGTPARGCVPGGPRARRCRGRTTLEAPDDSKSRPRVR